MVKLAYKGFNIDINNNLHCRDFKFEIGKEYSLDGDLELYKNGFHFYWNLNDVNNFYDFHNSIICEVEITGDILNDVDMKKSCTNKLKISRVLTKEEVLRLSNSGDNNSGYCNSGDCNTGDCNSGDCNTGNRNSGDRNSGNRNSGNRNSGDWNTGDCNSGYCNSGDWNTGDCNTGNRNSGDWNTGNWNSGNRNSGDWNTGDCNTGNRNSGDWNTGNWNTGDWNTSNRNTGFFNTKQSNVYLFNKLSSMSAMEFRSSKYYNALTEHIPLITEWIYYTKEECENDKAKELIGGYLKKYDYKEAHKIWWSKLSDNSKKIIQEIPNFDRNIFKEITGIEI